MRRRRTLRVVGALLVVASAAIAFGAEAAPSSFTRLSRSPEAVGRLVDALGTGRSYKVRIQAAALLGRLKDPRAYQALARAAGSDGHPMVRAFVVRTLARNPGGDVVSGQQARLAIGRAMADRDPTVRRQAALSMADLERRLSAGASARRGPTTVAVGQMGDRTGRASRAFRDRMRDELRALLAREAKIQLAESPAADGVNFMVDGTISKLSLETTGPNVEATCAVQLVVSKPPRGIVTIASGEAVVQKPTRYFRPTMRARMEADALDNAVKSAHETLSRFLAAQ